MNSTDELATLSDGPFVAKIKHFQELLANRNKLVFLIGAGCSSCAGLPLIQELTCKVLNSGVLDCEAEKVLEAVRERFDGANNAHIEHYISEIVDWLAIHQRRIKLGANNEKIKIGSYKFEEEDLLKATNQIKKAIARTIRQEVNICTHRTFVRLVHKPIRTGRSHPSTPVDYLVLNYDTVIEDALAFEQIPYTDGLEGGATAWWCEGKLAQDGWMARVFKLHGSIDWHQSTNDPLSLPRRVGLSVSSQYEDSHPILIWPSSTKYLESQLDPFAQLLEQARRALRSSRDAPCLLVICGYSFGDEHINVEVDRALREPHADLTIVAFTKEIESDGQLEKWHRDPEVGNRVLIFANGGFFHDEYDLYSDEDLMWWKFENVTRIIGRDI